VSFIPAERLRRLPTQFFSALAQKAAMRVRDGHDVINLGQGNPDLPTPPHIVEALRQAVLDPATHRYPPFSGLPALKLAVVNWYNRRFGVALDPESEVAILFGGKAGLIEISECLLNPGDRCLVPDPGYPDYWSGVALAGGEMTFMPLRENNAYLPDYSELRAEQLERVKLMFLNYPNNPTAAVADETFFRETVSFASKQGIAVVHDFAYGAIGFDGLRPRSFLQTDGAKNVGIEVYTMSKTYNMAGWRVGFALGNAALISMINLLQDHYYVSLFGAVQRAAVTALLGSDDCIDELVGVYERRRGVIVDGLTEAGWRCPKPGGSFFTWIPVPSGFTSTALADLLLERADVVVAPGVGFGSMGEGYVRLALLAQEDRLAEAVARIRALRLM